MEVKTANIDDITQISNLYCELITTLSELQSYFFKESRQDEKFIRHMIENEKSEIFIACENEKILGFVVIQEQETYSYNMIENHKFVCIFDMVISSDYKLKGIRKSLMNKCKNWAKTKNLEYIQLSVLNNNELVIKFYESQNFEKQMVTMYSKL